MKLFYVERTDNCDWDEYDSCVICAESENDVEKMINEIEYDFESAKYFYKIDGIKKYIKGTKDYSDSGMRTINYIGESHLKEPQIICSSFNAG